MVRQDDPLTNERDRGKLTALFRQLPVAVSVYAPPDYRVALTNDAYRAFIPGREIEGKLLREALPGIDLSSTFAHLDEVCRTKGPLTRPEHAVPLRDPDGQVRERFFTSTFQPIFDEDGELFWIVATSLEVTGEVLARRSLAESAKRFRLVLDEMTVGVNVRDSSTGQVVLSNKASAHILGVDLSAGPALEHSWDARHLDGRPFPMEEQSFRRVLQTSSPVRDQLVRIRKVGTLEDLIVRTSAVPARSDDGLELVISVFEDITEAHRLQEQRAQTMSFAEQFMGILGHDLRNPLQAITMATAVLVEQGQLGENEAKRVQQIASSSRRMARMVEQLLDVTRARLGGGIAVERTRSDLVKSVTSVLDELSAAHPSLELRRSLPSELMGDWDRDRLEQVVSNLVGNAIQHGDPARPVTVTLSVGNGDRGPVVLEVHNHGLPIPEAGLEELFAPWSRGAEDAPRRTNGLGLGLFITREIVAAHGGTVGVRSSAEEGTRFVVTLPRG
jgi:signal transduction histidine kinase